MKPVILTILDGFGLSDSDYGNAYKMADTKVLDMLLDKYPNTKLSASGKDVGLPDLQMGNSEVGHMNIGAGRVVFQPLELINQKIATNEFFLNSEINAVIDHAISNKSKLHICGLLSDGGVHSHINHLFAIIDLCKKKNINNVYYHIFLDGRDTYLDMQEEFLNQLNDKIIATGIGKIATISGRYYAMDRDNRWDRIYKSYRAMVYKDGDKFNDYHELVKHNKENNITDEFVVPAVIDESGMIDDNDGVLVFNFRPDRLRELFMAISSETFNEFEHKVFKNIKLTTMMPVSSDVISNPAFTLEKIENGLGEYLARIGKKQLRIAETEKYAHVTYFFDGCSKKNLAGCDKILIDSPKVATYDMKPEMSAYEVCDRLLLEMEKYDFIVLNFANCDMVGHTGKLDATIKAVEAVDECLGKIFQQVEKLGGLLIVTADHGNCEMMLEDGKPVTAHTTNLVPFIVANNNYSLHEGKLGDIAPTILDIMEIDVPVEMMGNSLLN